MDLSLDQAEGYLLVRRVDARSVGVIGCGVQARHALAAILHTRSVGRIALYDRRDGQAEQLR